MTSPKQHWVEQIKYLFIMQTGQTELNCLLIFETFQPAGWGKITHPGPSHYKMQQAKLKVVNNMECSRALYEATGGKNKDILKVSYCSK